LDTNKQPAKQTNKVYINVTNTQQYVSGDYNTEIQYFCGDYNTEIQYISRDYNTEIEYFSGDYTILKYNILVEITILK